MDPVDILKNRIKIFHEIKEDLSELDYNTELDYDGGSWSGIKLFAYSYYNGIYTHIIQNNFKEYYYIDPFSGSGMTKIKGIDDTLPGSPLIAGQVKYPYSKLFLSDKNGDKLELLERRLEKLNIKNYKIFTDENGEGLSVEKSLPKMVDEVQKAGGKSPPYHTLAVIDPEGYIPSWKIMENLGKISCDLLFTFFPHELGRTKKSEGKKALEKFFSSSREKDWTKEFYLDNLKKLDFNHFKEFPCKKGGNRYAAGYKIMIIWATQQENPKWLSSVDSLKDICESNTGEQIEFVNKLLNGEVTTLTQFFKQENKEDFRETTLQDFT